MRRTVEYQDGKLTLIDQTVLPGSLRYVEISDVEGTAAAIKDMIVRGAPAIGATGAAGMAIAARCSSAASSIALLEDLRVAGALLNATRPTAVNLAWGIDRMLSEAIKAAEDGNGPDTIITRLDTLASRLLDEDEETNKTLGQHGSELLADDSGVLTHCNAGALACVGYGTALGVIRAAVESGKIIRVYSDETRPRLQGMKLTCYELMQDGIDVTLIADNMAASLMRAGKIQAVVVGADRIAANGDTANKIGTYSVAVAARYHNIPFYVAAPISTIDMNLKNGDGIPIEERSNEEVTHIDGIRIAPAGVKTINPSFDVTPAELVTAIITEKGIAYPPYNWKLT
jgi:methylthioribose-1-phosphate isomerase